MTHRFHRLLDELRATGADHRFALASLNDHLASLTPEELPAAVADADLAGLSPFLRNYVAAMVEQAAVRRGVPPPTWVGDVEPLDEPYFAAPLKSLRPHLLRSAPVAFKRRNLFVDSTIGRAGWPRGPISPTSASSSVCSICRRWRRRWRW